MSRPGTTIVEGSVLGSHLGGFGGIGVVMTDSGSSSRRGAIMIRRVDAI